MSVSMPHQAYLDAMPTWQSLRDAFAGSSAVKSRRGASGSLGTSRGVKEAGTQYLSRPAGMKRQAQYDAYKARAVFLGATARAVHGLAGAVMRRPPVLTAPETILAHTADITLTGMPLASFAEQALRETLLIGRYGVLVDLPMDPLPGVSRPYWVAYTAEDILNWRTTQRQGQTVLSLVVLREYLVEPSGGYPSPDYFVTTTRCQYRVLRLDEHDQYEVSLWREVPGATPGTVAAVTQERRWVPTREGVPLDFLPFTFLAPFSMEPTIEASLLAGLVEVNYQYYRHSADYEHGLHLTALPTPYITGYSPDSTTFEIGSATAWVIPEPAAKVGMLEFQGQGLGSHERALAADIQNMAALGARLLEGQPLVPETATAVLARSQGTQSPVQSLVSTISRALTKALQWHAYWAGVTETSQDPRVVVQLNTDLVSMSIDPAMLRELIGGWLSGAFSFESLYENLRKGELTRPGIDAETEQALIDVEQASKPQPLLLGTGGFGNGQAAGIP